MVEFIIADKISVRGDNTLLQAVLENLMHNAWKFTAKHKTARIEFGVTMMHGHSVYFVKDDGAGFDMQFAGKLFMPFNRFHTESELSASGSAWRQPIASSCATTAGSGRRALRKRARRSTLRSRDDMRRDGTRILDKGAKMSFVCSPKYLIIVMH